MFNSFRRAGPPNKKFLRGLQGFVFPGSLDLKSELQHNSLQLAIHNVPPHTSLTAFSLIHIKNPASSYHQAATPLQQCYTSTPTQSSARRTQIFMFGNVSSASAVAATNLLIFFPPLCPEICMMLMSFLKLYAFTSFSL